MGKRTFTKKAHNPDVFKIDTAVERLEVRFTNTSPDFRGKADTVSRLRDA